MARSWIRCLLFSVMLAPSPAWSTVIFSNLGPGDDYLDFGLLINSSRSIAVDFTPSATGSLTSVRLPLLTLVHTADADLVVSLRAPGAEPNGTVLESWTVDAADPGSGIEKIEVLTSVVAPTLFAGSTYWLRLESPVNTGSYGWPFNSTGDLGFAFSTDQGQTWLRNDRYFGNAFEVNATVVPEPAAALLLLGGLSMLAVYRRYSDVRLASASRLPGTKAAA